MTVDEMRRSNWEYRVEPIGLLRPSVEARLQNLLEGGARPGAESIEQRPEAEKRLNALGRDGWELVSIISEGRYRTAILKRPIAD